MTSDYEIIRSEKRKTVTLKLSASGKLEVLAPLDMDDAIIRNIVEKKQFWIYKTRKKAGMKESLREKEYISGELFWYLGRRYRLDIGQFDEKGLCFKKSRFLLHHDNRESAEELFKQWYKQKAKEKLIARVEKYAKQMGVLYKSVKVLEMQKRWGSCTSEGNVILNYHLIKAPLSSIDYVIIHELAHVIEHNHSNRFWNIIKTQMDDYTKQQERLNTVSAFF